MRNHRAASAESASYIGSEDTAASSHSSISSSSNSGTNSISTISDSSDGSDSDSSRGGSFNSHSAATHCNVTRCGSLVGQQPLRGLDLVDGAAPAVAAAEGGNASRLGYIPAAASPVGSDLGAAGDGDSGSSNSSDTSRPVKGGKWWW